MNINKKNIIAVDVYLEKRRSRVYVGRLLRDDKKYIFTYDDAYLHKDRAIPLGPDLPLTKQRFTQSSLFETFLDRIPSKKNPAYGEYSRMVGIAPDETDFIVLLATLGHRGPSSFIFTPVFEALETYQDVIDFRRELNLSVREFSQLFDVSTKTIMRIEQNSTLGKEAMKRLSIYCRFPEVALDEVKKNRYKLSEEKAQEVEAILAERLKNESLHRR